MSAEKPHRDNSGVLYENRRKTPGDNRPDMTGEATIGGKRYWVSLWDKGRFDSLAFTEAKPKQGTPPTGAKGFCAVCQHRLENCVCDEVPQ